ncbi:UDP-4-amino-4-deoxy-L-arabinose-oxoglutarate aminotransferase [Burkholderiales bacterium]|nr:MAG: DegT/DnrJ/EryC1/StrS aminotransferase family protein [Burkholderiales bacterium]CAG0998295.1 UDP-4-amino-4-deoxy-L-arabinose-oxoglutarate aminotransferase [Burkholderiales bacterium]
MSELRFLPFARPEIDETTISGVAEVLRSGWIASGPQVLAFEEALSAYFGGRPTRVLTSATAGLEVALQLCRIGPGDEVISSAQTFFAAANMIVKVGAKPVFVDVDPATRNLDLAACERAITPATRAILPTHFAGLPVDMDALYALAGRHHLRVIEDAALAIGSSWQGRRIGSYGDIAVFSFHPNKNMTSIEGGALVVNTPEEARQIEILRFHGITPKPDKTRDVALAGGKFNLPDVNARVGLGQLARLDEFTARRQALVAHYFRHWHADPACELPQRGHPGDEAGHSWNMFAPLLPLAALRFSRAEVRERLLARGIGTGVSYEPLHLATLYRGYGYREGDFPHCEHIGASTLTLPLFTTMTEAEVERVCTTVAEVLAEGRR